MATRRARPRRGDAAAPARNAGTAAITRAELLRRLGKLKTSRGLAAFITELVGLMHYGHISAADARAVNAAVGRKLREIEKWLRCRPLNGNNTGRSHGGRGLGHEPS